MPSKLVFGTNHINKEMYGVSLLVFAGFCLMAHAEIYDPMNIFCGSLNCYDILNLNRSSSFQEIRKSFRQLSLTKHPDKSKNDNATEVYRLITKAYKVVGTNESRVLFDYYLDHPRDYFKVSGHHYVKAVPKSNVFVVVLGALLLISWFFHVVQYQRWEKASTYLKHATLNNLALKNGGTKETAAMYNQAVAKYEDHCAKSMFSFNIYSYPSNLNFFLFL